MADTPRVTVPVVSAAHRSEAEGGAEVPSSWSIRYQGLATREEAPAEVGVSQDDLAALGRVIGIEYYAGSDRLGEALERILQHIRAQPPAREDAQPVAWRIEYLMPNGRVSGVQLFGNHASVEFARKEASQPTAVQPLYTHPAPDALRAALEEARDAVAFFDQVKAATQAEQTAVGRDRWNRMEAALRTLASLQAEQKGGA